MREQPVILGFVPTSVTPLGSNAWSVTATVDDPQEINDGWAIARGDVVYLDQRASTTAPGTAGRYVVASILSKSGRTVSLMLDWDAASSPVSPAECLGVRGYLAQPIDVVGTVAHPAQQTILLQQEFIDLAKLVEVNAIGDDATELEQVRTLPTEEILDAGRLVHITPAGMAVLAIPQDPTRMPAAGIVLSGSAGQVRVRFSGIAPRVGVGLLIGAPVFVGDGGLPVTDPVGITLPAAVQMMGVALDSTTIALAVTGAMTKRS